MRNLVLTTAANGTQIRLGDVADVQDTQKDTEKLARINRKASIAIQIIKQSDANAVEVSEGTHLIIEKLKAEYEAEKLDIKIVNDSSTFTLELRISNATWKWVKTELGQLPMRPKRLALPWCLLPW